MVVLHVLGLQVDLNARDKNLNNLIPNKVGSYFQNKSAAVLKKKR